MEALDSFGCKTDNCFLAFLQDNLFPNTTNCGHNQGGDIDLEVRQRSWRRRVDLNMAFYMGPIIILSGKGKKFHLSQDMYIIVVWIRFGTLVLFPTWYQMHSYHSFQFYTP